MDKDPQLIATSQLPFRLDFVWPRRLFAAPAMECPLCKQMLPARCWSESQWKDWDPTAHGLNYCKRCDPQRVGITEEESVETLTQLEEWVRVFQHQQIQAHLAGFMARWLQWTQAEPSAFYHAHKVGVVRLTPANDGEDAGNKSYMLLMRLFFPRATLDSGLQKAEKLGDIVESLFGYAEICGQLQHRFFRILTEVIRLLRRLAPLLPKTHVVQIRIFAWESFEALVRKGAHCCAKNCR